MATLIPNDADIEYLEEQARENEEWSQEQDVSEIQLVGEQFDDKYAMYVNEY